MDGWMDGWMDGQTESDGWTDRHGHKISLRISPPLVEDKSPSFPVKTGKDMYRK